MGGKQYGVYFKAANKSLVWYNTKVFENAGVERAQDLEGPSEDRADDLDSGVTPVSVGGADGWTLTDWFENVYLSQAGPEKYDQLAQHKIKWTDPSVKAALTTLAAALGQEGPIAGGANGALQTEFPTSVTQTFTGGDQPEGGHGLRGRLRRSVTSPRPRRRSARTPRSSRSRRRRGKAPVVTGGDAAVILKDSQGRAGAADLPGLHRTRRRSGRSSGGFLSPNKNAGHCPPTRTTCSATIAKALVAAGDDFRFDMSDQAPQAFGGTHGKGEWKDLQDFLKNPKDVAGTQAKLEADAAKAYKRADAGDGDGDGDGRLRRRAARALARARA